MEQAGVQTRSQARQEEACEEEVSLVAIMKFMQTQSERQEELLQEQKVQLQEQGPRVVNRMAMVGVQLRGNLRSLMAKFHGKLTEFSMSCLQTRMGGMTGRGQ
ncbi:hypothetical protein Pcinc_005843 [Petrolisthes cinctipes]|uniref:Uncharacterized protein n=1 Tax=Petrolisthes cinctipes TaxID=88211 RepID=A0AAE1KYW1_PETCI|nr:hypothetical protein Pcinc_005843 [Petrolisthes cinctipes]